MVVAYLLPPEKWLGVLVMPLPWGKSGGLSRPVRGGCRVRVRTGRGCSWHRSPVDIGLFSSSLILTPAVSGKPAPTLSNEETPGLRGTDSQWSPARPSRAASPMTPFLLWEDSRGELLRANKNYMFWVHKGGIHVEMGGLIRFVCGEVLKQSLRAAWRAAACLS